KDGSYRRISQNEEARIHPFSKVFFFKPGKMRYKFDKLEVGIGNARGNVMFGAELKLEESHLPKNVEKSQIDFIVNVFRNETSAREFIGDNIPADKLEAAQAAAAKLGNQIYSYVLSHKAAVEEDT